MKTQDRLLIYDRIADTARKDGLDIMGALHEGGTTLVLLGPGPGFWPIFRRSPELSDAAPDPVDRWSRRILTAQAGALGATALFPFGLPHNPFLAWALASGRAWSSPVGMLVHDTAGLMISYRGALRFDTRIALPAPPAASPCDACTGRPCLTACPVGALGGETGYDVAACHGWLDTTGGQDCMSAGCLVRRACPVSQRFGRDPDQSALHMKAFHRS